MKKVLLSVISRWAPLWLRNYIFWILAYIFPKKPLSPGSVVAQRKKAMAKRSELIDAYVHAVAAEYHDRAAQDWQATEFRFSHYDEQQLLVGPLPDDAQLWKDVAARLESRTGQKVTLNRESATELVLIPYPKWEACD